MSVKEQIPSVCKLFLYYEEIPEDFLLGTYKNSYFYHNIFAFSWSQLRIARDSKGCNKESFATKLFLFYDVKTEQRLTLQGEVSISKKELASLVDSLRYFLKTIDQASRCLHIPVPTPKNVIGYTESKQTLYSLLQRYN